MTPSPRLLLSLTALFKTGRLLGWALMGWGVAQITAAQVASVGAVASAPARIWVSPPAGDALRGAALYQSQCTACHSVETNEIGPAHRGVMGRRIGSLPGYKYSAELASSRLRWTPQTLFTWLGDPEDLVAGQRMGFAIEDEQQRGDLIAYLATLK